MPSSTSLSSPKAKVTGGRRYARRRRTPMFLQCEPVECGAACLRSVLAFHGRWVPIEELREACNVGRDGTSSADLLRVARQYGLEAKGWRRSMRRIHLSPMPAILFWQFNHFVVLEGVDGDRCHINDPARGHVVMSEEAFDRSFTGVVLQMKPGPKFQTNQKPPGALRRLWPLLGGFRPALALAALYALLLALAALVAPLLLTLVVDHVLPEQQTAWNLPVISLMFGLGLATYLLTWLQLRALRRLAVGVAVTHSDKFITHLLRLPIEFFNYRLAGDLMSRMQIINDIAQKGAGQLIGLVVEVLMGIVFLGVMFAYSPSLALAVLTLAVLGGLLMRHLAQRSADYNYQFRRERGILSGMAMAGLRRLELIRATASENSFFTRWGSLQANELKARQSFEELRHVVDALPGFVIMLGSVLVLGLGAWQVMAGDMTLGMLMGFYVLAGHFLRPVGRLAQFNNELQSIKGDMGLLDDVFNAPISGQPEDSSSEDGQLATLDGRLRLTGHIELRNVTFGFHRNKPPLIENFNLTIRPGERVAVVGPSGAGKTSLSLLVAGVYQPWSGEILFDGHRLEEIPRELFAASLGVVDQHPMLFHGTILENLTFWNTAVPEDQVVNAARDADIHYTIVDRPGRYDAPVEENGRNFSGGQRQRLEIARALVNNPSVLVLDEATSALDAITEVRIDNALRRRGCACLIVAHRLSTIRDSDLIVVMKGGKEVQRGSHEALMATDGPYRKLVNAP